MPVYFVYGDDFVEFPIRGMVAEPNPVKWPAFGKLEFKLDGRATEAPILKISDDELAVQVDDQVFRGLDKNKFLSIFGHSPGEDGSKGGMRDRIRDGIKLLDATRPKRQANERDFLTYPRR